MAKSQPKQLVVCIDNEGHAASLEKRKIYIAIRDARAEKHRLIRVIDESGEDYLYPKTFFRSIALPQAVKKAVLAAAWRSRRRVGKIASIGGASCTTSEAILPTRSTSASQDSVGKGARLLRDSTLSKCAFAHPTIRNYAGLSSIVG
jgi:hypothetical protein